MSKILDGAEVAMNEMLNSASDDALLHIFSITANEFRDIAQNALCKRFETTTDVNLLIDNYNHGSGAIRKAIVKNELTPCSVLRS